MTSTPDMRTASAAHWRAGDSSGALVGSEVGDVDIAQLLLRRLVLTGYGSPRPGDHLGHSGQASQASGRCGLGLARSATRRRGGSDEPEVADCLALVHELLGAGHDLGPGAGGARA